MSQDILTCVHTRTCANGIDYHRLINILFLCSIIFVLRQLRPFSLGSIMDVATSNNASSSTSSRLSISKSPSLNNPSNSTQTFVEERPYELNSLYGEPTLPGLHRMTRFSRVSRSLANWNPRLHEWMTKAVLYVRGPRPKVDLAGTSITPYFKYLSG